jgi:hypothetical protein
MTATKCSAGIVIGNVCGINKRQKIISCDTHLLSCFTLLALYVKYELNALIHFTVITSSCSWRNKRYRDILTPFVILQFVYRRDVA